MVCKRDWGVDRGGGSPMTTTGPADVVMAACSHAVAGPLVPARPRFRELVSVLAPTGGPLPPPPAGPPPGRLDADPSARPGARSAVSPVVFTRASALLVPARVA